MAEPSISFRLKSTDGRGLLGQRRHDQRIGKQPAYVDELRAEENVALYRADGWERRAGETEQEDTARIHALMEESRQKIIDRAKRKTTVGKYWRTSIITFSHEAQARLATLGKMPHQEALAAFQTFAAAHGVKMLSVDFHGDESAPHYHATFEGVNEKGYALRMDRETLGSEQDHFAEHFSDFGFVRGKKKVDRIADGDDPATYHHREVKELHQQRLADIAALAVKIADLTASAEKARINLDRTKEKIALEEAQGKAASDRLTKRLADYEKRFENFEAQTEEATKRLAALKNDVGELETKKAGLEADLETITDTVAQKKTSVTSLTAKKAALEARLRSLNAA